jgi:hypothetical protein
MSDEKPGISQAGSLPGEAYRDARSIIIRTAASAMQPFKRRNERRAILAAFQQDFPDHGPKVTDIADYGMWHESDADWTVGNGSLHSTTYGELPHIWTRPERFVRYEAHLLRYIRAGGEAYRVFVLGPELHSDAGRFPLYRTLRRHVELGFKPHVRSVLDLQKAAAELGVSCDTFGTLNGRIAYFLQSHDNGDPTMVRSVDAALAFKAQSLCRQLLKGSSSASEFFERHPWEIPPTVIEDIRRDIETIQELAHENPR